MQRFFFFFVFFLSCTASSGSSEVKIPKSPVTPSSLLEVFPEQQTKGDHFECAKDEECQDFIVGSKCEESRCRCGIEEVLSSDGSKCLQPARKFGVSCEDNVQCSHLLSAGGSCIEKKCACKPDYHYLKGLCWKNLGLHQICKLNEQCFSDHEYVGLECRNFTCRCRQGYYERFRSGCRKKMNVAEPCNLDSDCPDEAKCRVQRCSNFTAPPNLVEIPERKGAGNSNLKRLKGTSEPNDELSRELGMNCTNNDDCNHIKRALCLSGRICGCQPPLYVASNDNRKCLQASRGQVEDITKSSCKEDVQCGVYGGRSICLDSHCACKNGSYWEKIAKFCWTVKSLNESCSDDRDCHPLEKHAECLSANENEWKSEKVCRCQQGFHPKKLDCIPDALKVGDYCETKSECLFPNSTCDQSSKACTCEENYYVEDGKCRAGIGSPCAEDADCGHLANTDCRQGRCSCLDDHAPSEGNHYCLPVVAYEGICKESFQCNLHLGDFGECRGGFCQCNGSAHYSHGRCYESKGLGNACLRKQDCFGGDDENSVICLKGRCACHYDYVSDGSRTCVKKNSGTRAAFPWLLLAAALALST